MQVAAKPKKHLDAHSAWVLQYTALNLLTQVAKRIDDLLYENFHVPVLLHQERVRHSTSDNERREVGHVYAETDYVDAQPVYTYTQPNWTLRVIATADELQRLEVVVDALKGALHGKTIALAQLRRALTAEQLQEFNDSLAEVVEISEIEYGEGMPERLRDYNKKLNKADIVWGRFESMPTTPKFGAKRRLGALGEMEDRAVSLYEDALEDLEETFDCAKRGDWGSDMLPRLERWMDRPVDFDAGFDRQVDINVHAMPRVRGSKSRYAEDSGLPKLSKRLKRQYCAMRSLFVAMCEIAFEVPYPQPVEISAADKTKLQVMLKNLRTKN